MLRIMMNTNAALLFLSLQLISFFPVRTHASLERLKSHTDQLKADNKILKEMNDLLISLQEEASDLLAQFDLLESQSIYLNQFIVNGNNVAQVDDLQERVQYVVNLVKTKEANMEKAASVEDAVSSEELAETFVPFDKFNDAKANGKEVSEPSNGVWETELELSEHAVSIGKEIIRSKVHELFANNFDEENVVSPKRTCVSSNEAQSMVQDSLKVYFDYNTGLTDHAIGSSIVYENGRFTSETYTPDDLPVPSFIYYAFGGITQAIFGKNIIQSAESVISDGSTYGSHWAFAGQKGKLTILLREPVYLSAVSIENVVYESNEKLSAPDRFNIVGYEPCTKDECSRLGFEAEKGVFDLGEYNFTLDSKQVVQTFLIGNNDAKKFNGDEGESDDDEDFGGSCGFDATPESCGEETLEMQSSASYPIKQHLVAAITMNFSSNHGNEKFTSLYRLRVHGDTAK